MRLFALFLTVLLVVACAGDPQPPAETAAVPPTGSPTETDTEDPLNLVGGARFAKVVSPEWERVEGFTKQFYDGALDQLYAGFSAGYKEEFSMQNLVDLRERMLTEFGEEVEVVATRKEENQGYHAFFRAARFSGGERLIEVAFVIGPDESIAGLFVTPERTAESAAQ